MSTANDEREWIAKFEELCSSDDLSIDKLRTMIKEAPQVFNPDGELRVLENSSFLHRVCLNKNITLEIVKYLVDLYEPALHDEIQLPEEYIVSAYPLHLACYNKDCPNDVLELLIVKCGPKDYFLAHMCFMNIDWGKTGIDRNTYGGTPLHYYLSRTSNLDLGIVEQLSSIERVLLYHDGESKCTPIHILLHNKNIGEMFDVVKYLAEASPDSLQLQDEYDQTPLQVACSNGHITARTIELLLRVCPDSIRQPNNWGGLPIHSLCEVKDMDGEVAIGILNLFLEAHPDSVSETVDAGELPLHIAAWNKSSAFCKILVDAYPESVRRVDSCGSLPLHNACGDGRPDTVEYLFGLYQESINIRNHDGYLPIHFAANTPGENTAEIVNVLLRHDPECLSKPVVSDSDDDGSLPLHLVCLSRDKSNVTEFLFDLYPEAILIRNEEGQLPFDVLRSRDDGLPINPDTGKPYDEELRRRNRELLAFLSGQMSNAYKAQDENALRRRDCTGLLPLHTAIRSGAQLGSIKLLVKGNPDAVHAPDGSGKLPLDIACQFCMVDVVKYLAELAPKQMNTCDRNKNYPLHHACRGGNCKVISYLLGRPMSSASVSKRNTHDMLPIQLFCEFVKGRWCEGETPEYTETIWRLLIAYPETVLNW